MHATAREYLESVRDRFPDHFKNKTVLEYGSMNVNGTPRDLFKACTYIGVDWLDGTDVDVVSRMHEYQPPDDTEIFTIITSSAMEHDLHLWKSMNRCWEILAPGGLFFGTCPTESWPEHNKESGEDGHYAGIPHDTLHAWVTSLQPAKGEVLIRKGHHQGSRYNNPSAENYFYALKKEDQ